MNLPKVTGIVAEYNPLHNGHVYQLNKAKELSGAEALIVVLSSDFVQRGEPAFLSMHERAKLAVLHGADLVLELPALFSCGNAGIFADSAVKLSAATGIVKTLSFGMEDPDWDLISAASILVEEPDSFKFLLKKNLESGFSFAEARVNALDSCMPGAASKLAGSNNSLALNYASAIIKNHCEISLVPVQRTGTAHDTSDLSEAYASSSALRNMLRENNLTAVKSFVPEKSAQVIKENLSGGTAYVSHDRLWTALRPLLLRSSSEDFFKTAEISEGIENKFIAEALSAGSFDEWLERCTSRRYPKGRIRRQAMQLLLGTDRWTRYASQRLGVPYIRPLAMNANGRELLKIMKETAKLPVIAKCGDAKFSAYAEKIMQYDLLASELRRGFLPCGNCGTAHAEKIYIAD